MLLSVHAGVEVFPSENYTIGFISHQPWWRKPKRPDRKSCFRERECCKVVCFQVIWLNVCVCQFATAALFFIAVPTVSPRTLVGDWLAYVPAWVPPPLRWPRARRSLSEQRLPSRVAGLSVCLSVFLSFTVTAVLLFTFLFSLIFSFYFLFTFARLQGEGWQGCALRVLIYNRYIGAVAGWVDKCKGGTGTHPHEVDIHM